MQIMLLIHTLARGGAEKQCLLAARFLDSAGHDVCVVRVNDRNDYARELADTGVTLLRLRRGRFGRVRELADHLRHRRPDVVHSFDTPTNILACRACRKSGIGTCFLGCRAQESMAWFRQVRQRRIASAGRWIVNSPSVGESVRRQVHLAGDVVSVVPNALDSDAYRSDLSPEEARERLGLLPDVPVVLHVANYRRMKNHELSLRVAGRVAERYPDVRFLLAGHGPRRRAMEALCGRLGLEQTVQLLGVRNDMPVLLAAADVVILTSHARSEGLPNALLEAAAAGRPVVATRCGAEDVVLDNETGYLVPCGGEEALSKRIMTLLEDDALRASLGSAGAEHVRRNFSPQAMLEALLSAYAHGR